jgi:hypothetical protein
LSVGLAKLWVELKAMQKSTHQVQYVNMSSQEFQAFNKDLEEKMTKDVFDNLT